MSVNTNTSSSSVGLSRVGICPLNNNTIFPFRLYSLLEDAACSGMEHIISWQAHGRCFRIHNRELFIRDILPVWFDTHVYGSFQRQLNMYGFKRVGSGPDRGGYRHDLFLRGRVELVWNIRRQTVKKHRSRNMVNKHQEVCHIPSNAASVPAVGQRTKNNSLQSMLSVSSMGKSTAATTDSPRPTSSSTSVDSRKQKPLSYNKTGEEEKEDSRQDLDLKRLFAFLEQNENALRDL